MVAAIEVAAEADQAKMKVYQFNGGDQLQEDSPFCVVHNEGSEAFKAAGLGHFFEDLDFESLGRRVLVECNDKVDRSRGNFQVNVLFNGGQAHRRSQKELLHDYGVAMPLPDKGTDEWMDVVLKFNRVCNRLGIWWLEDANLTDELRERRDTFPRSLHPRLGLEGMTTAAIRLYPDAGQVKPHVDSNNCPLLSEVVIMSQIVWLGDELWRVSLIGYMRKSCMDAMIRRDACKEVSDNTVDYIKRHPAFLRPAMSVEEHKTYYENVGELGLGLIIQNHPKTGFNVRSAALMTRPHMDKPMGYVSSVTSSILEIVRKNPHLTKLDIMLMCLPFGQLPGAFVYGSVLSEIAAAEVVASDSPIGPLQLIIDRIIAMAGSYSSGRFNRRQPGATEQTIRTDVLLRSGKCLVSVCAQFTEEPDARKSYGQHCANVHALCLNMIKRGCSGVGDFGAQSLIALLAQLGYLKPMGMLHIAQFAPNTATLKKSKSVEKTPNPAMRRYLYEKPGLSGVSDRAKRVMDSVVPHLKLKHPWMTSSIVEQISCESYRRKKAADFYFPGQKNYYHPFDTSSEVLHVWEMSPTINENGVAVSKKIRNLHQPKTHGEPRWQNLNNASGLAVGSYHQCRIPFKYMDAFEGLMKEVHGKFFMENSNLKDVANWIENHPILRALSEYFMSHDLPLKECYDELNGVAFESCTKKARTVKSPSAFAHLSPETYRHTGFCSRSENKTVSVVYEGSRKTWSSSIEHGNTVVKSVSSSKESSFIIETQNVSESVIELETNKCNSNFQSTGKGSIEFSGAQKPDHVASNDVDRDVIRLATSNTIKHYNLISRDAVGAMQGWKPQGIETVRKLALIKKDIYKGSPIFTELKRCLHFGLAEKDMPIDLHKGAFVPVVCTPSTHSIQGPRTEYYMSQWTSNLGLRFFEVGVCCLVDRIAVNLGGTKAVSLSSADVFNWVYPSVDQSNLHLMQCLVACGGKPGYFKRLMRNVAKQLKQKNRSFAQSPFAVVSVADRDKKVGPVFYVVMSLEDGACEKWSIAMSPGAITQGEPRWNSDSLVLDLWSWKNGVTMTATVSDDLKPAAYVGCLAGTKRARARKRRRLLRQKLADEIDGVAAVAAQPQDHSFMEEALHGSLTNFIERGEL